MDLIVKIGADSSPKTVGVKGSGLSRVYENKFPVPDGFILTTEAFRSFLRYNNLEKKIAETISNFFAQNSGKALKELHLDIEKLFIGSEMPEPLRNSLFEHYENMSIGREAKELGGRALDMVRAGRTYHLVSVRSSPTTEDVKHLGSVFCVKGKTEVERAVKKMWSCTFCPRMVIKYWKHDKTLPLMAVVVKKMVNAEKSGVVYTCNPDNSSSEQIVIESAIGIGDIISSGAITPDEYIISKPDRQILDKKIRKKTLFSAISMDTGFLSKRPLAAAAASLTDYDIKNITEVANNIEFLFQKPLEIEFCMERGRIYILQVRDLLPNNILCQETGTFVLSGVPANSGTARGRAKIISNTDYNRIEAGDIVVAKSLDTLIEENIEKIGGIITENGGRSSYPAVISKEFGIPSIVGAEKATDILRDGMEVEIKDRFIFSVSDAEQTETNQKPDIAPATENTAQNIAAENIIAQEPCGFQEGITATNIKMSLSSSAFDDRIAGLTDGVGMLSSKNMLTESCKNPFSTAKEDPEAVISVIANNLGRTARIFFPKTVWYRLFDARTDELKQLEGGSDEPAEANPLLGFHGIRRSLEEQSVLLCEIEAIKRLREDGINNIGILVPFISTAEEFRKIKSLISGIKAGISVDIPSAGLDIEAFCRDGAEYVLVNTDMLHPLLHGTDKDSGKFTGQRGNVNPLLHMLKHITDMCRQHKVETAVSGEFCSEPEMVSRFVGMGVDSIVLEQEYVEKIKPVVARAERKILLGKLRGGN